jgi:SAM-dependent methyltransferase
MSHRPADRDQLAAVFGHRGVGDAYRHRPPYPPEVFDILERIITDRPRRVLDLGAGEGALARPLAGRVDHVDALDISAAMVEAGRRRPGGGRPGLPDALAAEGLFEITGRATTAPVSFRQPVESFVEQFHSTASLAREWMSGEESAAFDQAITDIVAPRAVGGVLEMDVVAHLAWGRPTTQT